MKCATRTSPYSRLQPVTGTPGPPSGPPTECAPAIIIGCPARASASCAAVGLRHQRPGQRADDGEGHAQTQGPAQRPVGESLPPQRDGDCHADEGLEHDGRAHGREHHRIDGRRDVEVAGRAAPRLDVDDRDLEHEYHGRRPAHEAAHAPPLRAASRRSRPASGCRSR